MKKLTNNFIQFIKEEYKFILVLLLFTLILLYPVKYYIITGGGIKDIGKRVIVDKAYNEKGTFNISYVTELNGTVVSYLLSYVIPSWEREKQEDYAYNNEESLDDINERNIIYLNQSSNNAIYNAYKLANKEVSLLSTKIFILTKTLEYENDLKVGDQIVEVNNKTINELTDIKEEIQSKEINETIDIKIIRNKQNKNIKAKVYKDTDGNKVIGIVATKVNEYKTDPKVNVKFAFNEAGPSGGLITALSIYNKLVKEDITKGYTIAGTGTMEEDGTVGEIGGIEYKIMGANKKADFFLAPAGENYKTAKKIAKKKHLKIKIISVESLEDAINKLNNLK